MPSNHLILCRPLLFLLQSFPASESFLMSWLFTPGGQSIESSASVSVLLLSIQGSPVTQFKSINFSVLSLLYGPTLTSVHDYWKNQSYLVRRPGCFSRGHDKFFSIRCMRICLLASVCLPPLSLCDVNLTIFAVVPTPLSLRRLVQQEQKVRSASSFCPAPCCGCRVYVVLYFCLSYSDFYLYK